MRLGIPFVLVLSVAACAGPGGGPATQAPVARSTTVQVPTTEARSRAQAALTAASFTVTPSTTGLTATARGNRDDAIACPRARVVDDQSTSANRSYLAPPSGQRADVAVALVEAAGGTEVSVTVTGEATYRDRYRGNTFTGPCTSTGQVEQQVLAAIRGGG